MTTHLPSASSVQSVVNRISPTMAANASQDRPSVKVAGFDSDAVATVLRANATLFKGCFNRVASARKPAFSILGLLFTFKAFAIALCSAIGFRQAHFQFAQRVAQSFLAIYFPLAGGNGLARRKRVEQFIFAP